MIKKSALHCLQILICTLLLSSCATVPVETSGPAAEPGPETDTSEIYTAVMQAHYLSFSGDVEAGKALFEAILEQHPDDVTLRYQFAKFNLDLAYRASGQEAVSLHLVAARDNLRKVLTLEPGHIKARELLADISIEMGDFDEAVEHLTILTNEQPDNANANLALARLFVHLGTPEKAITMLEPFLEREILDNYEYLKVYALACGEADQLFEAIDAYQRYLEKFPMEFEASYNLALCFFRTSQYHNAEKVLTAMRDAQMMTPEVAELLTDVYRAQERYAEAIQLLETMASNSRYSVGAWIEIGQIYLGLDDLENAYKYLLRAVSKDPNNRRATFYTAVTLSELGKYEDALRMLENNLEDDPLSVPTVDLTTDILLKMGNTKSALKLGRQLLRDNPGDARSFLIYADILENAGMTAEAVNILREGRERFPENVRLSVALAYRLEQTGNWREAVAVFEELYVIRPGDPEIANFIGYTLADNNSDLERALELIEQALSVEPENPAYLDSLGWVYYRMGRFDDALELLKRAAQGLPEDPVVTDHLIQVLLETGNIDEARVVLERAMQSAPENPQLLKLKEQMEQLER